MIVSRREEKCSGIEHNDLFSLLLKGDENEKASMTEQEVMGNMYIFLLAGHGTTAHTLAFTFTLLALYPQHQERIYQEALATIGDRDPSYSDYHSLHYTQATFLEALRLFPVLPFFAKIASEDTTLTATTCQSRSQSVSKELTVPKGSVVIIAAQSLHFNPEYYPEPYEFRPSRFLDTEDTKWNRDACK